MINLYATKKKNKSIRIISIVILVFSFILLSYTVIVKLSNRVPSIFGYSFHVVVTQSMEPEIMRYDFIIAKKVNLNQITEESYLVFKSPDPILSNKIIIHKVEKSYLENNTRYFITKGIANQAADAYPVSEENVIGIYTRTSVALSFLIRTLINVINLIITNYHIFFIIILLILLVIIIILGKRIYKQIK